MILTRHDLRLTFLAYHLGTCLLLPLAISLAEGRGLHGRRDGMRPRVLPLTAATLAYASYHLATLDALLPHRGAVLPAFLGVLAAGAWWAWRRERRGDVWAPLLGHAGATAGYMAVSVAFVV